MVDRHDSQGSPQGITLIRTLDGATDLIYRLAWSTESCLVGLGTRDGLTQCFNPFTGELRFDLRTTATIIDLAFSSDGHMLAVQAGSLFVHDLRTMDLLQFEHAVDVFETGSAVDWSPTCNVLAAGTRNGRVLLCQAPSAGDHQVTLLHATKENESHGGVVNALAWAPSGKLLASVADDDGALIWDAEGRLIARLHTANSWGLSLAWSPDGCRLAVGSLKWQIHIWDVMNRKLEAVLPQQLGSVSSVSFSHDGRLLASKSVDDNVHLWRCDDWTPVATIPESSETWYSGMAFHPSEPFLATSGDNEVRVWLIDAISLAAQNGRVRAAPKPRELQVPEVSKRRKLSVFLCHAHEDKPAVRALYERLAVEPGISPWLDEKDLVPGQDWRAEITKRIGDSDAFVVFLSETATGKTGFVQKEMTLALDAYEMRPEGSIYVIPYKLEQCDIPARLGRFHAVPHDAARPYDELMRALRAIPTGPSESLQTPNDDSQARADFETWVEDAEWRWRNLVANDLPDDRNPYEHGSWTVAYRVIGDFQSPSLPDLQRILQKVKGRESNWAPWNVFSADDFKPYFSDNDIECWLARPAYRGPRQSHFWRVSPRGWMYLLRGYGEDEAGADTPPGSMFDIAWPVTLLGECLLHAERMNRALVDDNAEQASIDCRVSWRGLSGRHLVWLDDTPNPFIDGHRSRQDIVSSEIVVTPTGIRDGLPEVVQKLTERLYTSFDFFEPSNSLFTDYTAKMRKFARE